MIMQKIIHVAYKSAQFKSSTNFSLTDFDRAYDNAI